MALSGKRRMIRVIVEDVAFVLRLQVTYLPVAWSPVDLFLLHVVDRFARETPLVVWWCSAPHARNGARRHTPKTRKTWRSMVGNSPMRCPEHLSIDQDQDQSTFRK